MMSSGISTDGRVDRVGAADRVRPIPASHDTDAFQPWQLFTLAGLAAATAVVFVARDTGPAGVILLSVTVGAAAWLGHAAWRTLAPLFGLQRATSTEILGGRTRAALEREKVLVLRSIRDLEFDRAMGKVSDRDFAEMNTRLRNRAAGLLRQLDRGAGYRDEIERELAKRIAGRAGAVDVSPAARGPAHEDRAPAAGATDAAGRTCTCGTANDADARFCKSCGARMEAA
jgi:hypothetical protein